MASLPIIPSKRPASDSPQGEFQPAPVMAKTGHPIKPDMQTVLLKFDMDVPNDAMVDTEIDNDIVNTQVEHRLAKCLPSQIDLLNIATTDPKWNEDFCSHAVNALASVLLPATFDHSDRVPSYEDIIKCNPWLIKMLTGAYKSKEYHVIRRLRSCSVQIVCLPRLTPILRRLPLVARERGAAGNRRTRRTCLRGKDR
jgi:hypothetical protein